MPQPEPDLPRNGGKPPHILSNDLRLLLKLIHHPKLLVFSHLLPWYIFRILMHIKYHAQITHLLNRFTHFLNDLIIIQLVLQIILLIIQQHQLRMKMLLIKL